MLDRKTLIILIITLFPFLSFSGNDEGTSKSITWQGVQQSYQGDNQSQEYLYFDNAIYDRDFGSLPIFFERIYIASDKQIIEVLIEDAVFEKVSEEEMKVIEDDIIFISTAVKLESKRIIERKKSFYGITLLPFRKNPVNGEIEKLLSFRLKINKEDSKSILSIRNRSYKEHSVLSSGRWYKVSVETTGIYRITADDLEDMGIDHTTIDPGKIKLYGNGGSVLSENNSDFRYDDLVENSIVIEGEDDGVFDKDDYILFYGVSTNTWKYDTVSQLFSHLKNIYSDKTYYFLTIGPDNGKRIQPEYSTIVPQNYNVNTFSDFLYHEKDENNLIGSGKLWFGEVFNTITTYDYTGFSFPDIDLHSNVTITVDVAARSFINSNFTVSATGMPSPLILSLYAVSHSQNTDYAKTKRSHKSFLPSGPDIDVNITYNKSTNGSTGWLNYFELNLKRQLVFSGDQMSFRNVECVGKNNISEFTLSNVSSVIKIWDVSDPLIPKLIDGVYNNNEMIFRLHTDSLREFIAFNGNKFNEVEFVAEVETQDLHSIEPTDIIIVSHPDFMSQAERLAELHLFYDNLTTCIVTPDQVYNEFSSGKLDVTAIRDFVKMLYEKAPSGSEPKYLLLFGDGSYDNKNILNTNSTYVPTFQSKASLLSTATFVSDDYFGIMDDGEGYNANGSIDIGVGRLPVQTLEQATAFIDKIEHYMSPADTIDKLPGEVEKFGDWRNTICFVADDEDGNLHFNQAEYLAKSVDNKYKSYNVDKIYLDAYPQVSTPGGDRYPEVKVAINERMEKGALLVNYVGHGGEQGWAYENVIEIPDINDWDNYNAMPAFLTATCEFSRFDDPRHTTAGEFVVLNPNGGGISIFSTTRVAFASSNFSLTVSMYNHLFEKVNKEYSRLGDLIRYSKNDNNNDATIKNFVLLGDPALRLKYPNYSVVTTEINNEAVSTEADTLKSLQQVSIKGYIADDSESVISSYNGIVYPVIYDKAIDISTLNNDSENGAAIFKLQNNILSKGKARVVNGEFTYSFVIPKDINYNYGQGKISYYVENGVEDAHGYYDGIIIGGTDDNVINDNIGPSIQLYIDNLNFVSGGFCGEDPLLIAYLSDENGINAFGNGIGHEIVAELDGETNETIYLNEYFEPDMDTYQSGVVTYPFYKLGVGMHKIKLKAWDMLNNSSTAYIDLYVTTTDNIDLSYVMNYPNPVYDQTQFVFSHNQAGKQMDVKLQIYTIQGEEVFNREFNLLSEEYDTEFYLWDARGDNGNILSNGIYVYRIMVKNASGSYDAASQKLVILK